MGILSNQPYSTTGGGATQIPAADHAALRLLHRVLTMYYQEGLNQADIAEAFGLSTAKVNRLLKQAREQGMVEIRIRTPMQSLFDLEARLQSVCGVPEAVVVPQMSDDPQLVLDAVGRTAAQYLTQRLRDGDTICISGGKALSAVVRNIESSRKLDVQVVPATGGAQGRHQIDANYLASELAQRLGGTVHELHAPVIVDTIEERDALVNIRQISAVLDVARRAQIAVLGIGSVAPGSSTYFELPSLREDDRRRLVEEFCGTGELLAQIVNQSGRPCAPDYNTRVVGISLDDLRGIPLTIGVAATTTKIAPIISTLRGGYLKTLITDEVTARGVLEQWENDLC
ncbi:MAG: sugar-binding transcriptional regulator [Chloroflexi bacterium]|nr:sugar-binding transcriptional regulator [Chloroflexota bacterium]